MAEVPVSRPPPLPPILEVREVPFPLNLSLDLLVFPAAKLIVKKIVKNYFNDVTFENEQTHRGEKQVVMATTVSTENSRKRRRTWRCKKVLHRYLSKQCLKAQFYVNRKKNLTP